MRKGPSKQSCSGRPKGSRAYRGTKDMPPGQNFLKLLKYHMKESGVTLKQLCKDANIAHTTIRAWESSVGIVSKNNINRLIWALAKAYERKYEDTMNNGHMPFHYFGKARIDVLLDELYKAAGYQVSTGRRENFAWEHIIQTNHIKEISEEKPNNAVMRKKPILNVGWFPWSFFAYESHGDYAGASREIINEVCRLLGVTCNPVRCELREIPEAVMQGAIHLTLPLIYVPPRHGVFAPSDFLGPEGDEIKTGVNAVIHKNNLNLINMNINNHKTEHRESLPNRDAIDKNILRLYCIEGTINETLTEYLIGHSSDPYLTQPTKYTTLEEGWRDVIKNPRDADGKCRAFVCDEFTAKDAIKKEPTSAARLLVNTPVKLPLVIYAYRLEPMLIKAINGCLKIMADNNFWHDISKNFNLKNLLQEYSEEEKNKT